VGPNARQADLKALVAGAAGAAVALGTAELLGSFSALVPSPPVAVAQRVIELTPGALATAGISALGKAATPILVTIVVLLTLAAAGLLGVLARRSPRLALLGAAALLAVGFLASLAEPVVGPFETLLVLGLALALGLGVARWLLRLSEPAAAAPEPADPEPFRGRSREAGRRRTVVGRGGFLALAGGAALAGGTAAWLGRAVSGGEAVAERNPPAPLRGTGEGSGGAGAVPAATETLPPPPPGASIEVAGMPPLITPAEEFYLIDTAISSPRVDRNRWTLRVSGAVGEPLELSYSDLLSLPTREADVTLSCVSNEVGGGLVSNGRWTGVLLSDVLKETGVERGRVPRGGEQLVGRSVDGWTAGFRTNLALDGREALVAFGLNGSELPVEHGYPARLVVPGLYGYVSATKWLSEIELTGWDFDAYWIQRGWSKTGPVKTQSRIDTVRAGQRLRPGPTSIGGVAWAPHRGISRVEVSTDGGATWNEARLAEQLSPDSWRQYVYEWNAEPGSYTLQVRATDGRGETQTADTGPPVPSGATGYHTVPVSVDA